MERRARDHLADQGDSAGQRQADALSAARLIPLLLASALSGLLIAGCSGSGRSESGRVIQAEVERVVDGDTIDVLLDGETVPVRYIGIDTAEMGWSGSGPECQAVEATEKNRALVEGKTVRLVVGEEPYDRYDRLLAYVYAGGRMVNAELLRAGMAETLTIPPNDRFSERFQRIEAAARDSDRGRWANCD